jgi:hypothetical protein
MDPTPLHALTSLGPDRAAAPQRVAEASADTKRRAHGHLGWHADMGARA